VSALPLRARPRIVTTSGEFHSLRRQLRRLAEEGLEVVVVPARPAVSLAERLVAAIDDRAAAAMVSSVFFDTAEIVPGLDLVAAACARVGAELLVDAYHHVNVLPFSTAALGLDQAFVTGGGYKYCQLGEGNCFLRVPPGCRMRPIVTGWFAELAALDVAPVSDQQSPVFYENGPEAFAGATYDPTSHYRAAAVFAFHREHSLTPDRLRASNRRQMTILKEGFERLDIDPRVAAIESMPDDRRGGFLAIRCADAATIARALRQESVSVDARGDLLRVGPAPYVRDDQLAAGIEAIGRQLRRLTTSKQ
jgi:kynureninase